MLSSNRAADRGDRSFLCRPCHGSRLGENRQQVVVEYSQDELSFGHLDRLEVVELEVQEGL